MVVAVGPRFRMSNQEPLPPKDYYVDLGRRDGLKEGDALTVYREVVPMHGQLGLLQYPVRVLIGEAVVMAVGEKGSFVRQANAKPAGALPFSEFPSFMLGDEVQTKTSLPFKQ